MSEYIVSARKYRPDTFESLIGQDNIVQTLKNSIKRGQLAHAYLFCGPRGVGKTSAARIFAKTINCSNLSEDMEPCGHCESCRSFQEGRSYCIHELDAASNNSIDDMKALIEQVNVPPQVGKYSVFIVDEVHMLSTAAFNAFLKTLEEPPAHAIFILATTEKHKVLPTILSRCQTYDFNRISVPDMVRNLRMIADSEGVKIGDESLHVIAMKADGAMRDALTIFDQTVAFCGTDVKYEEVLKNLNVLDYDYSFSLVDAFLSGEYKTALLKFDEVLSKGFNALHFVSALSSHLRNLLVAGTGGLESLLELPDSLKARYREQASRCPLSFLYEGLGITSACESGYRASMNPRLHIEYALLRLCYLMNKPLQSAVARPAAASPAPVASRPGPSQEPASPKPEQAAATPEPASPKPEQAAATPEPASPESAASGAPRTRRRPARKPSTLSIAAIENEGKPEAVAEENAEGDKLPDDQMVMDVWKTLLGMYADRPRLAGTLSSAKVELGEENGMKTLTFYVVNSAQKQWIEERLLHGLENTMRSRTGSSKLILLVSVMADEEVEAKPYMPQEQAMELMANNPEVKNLVKDLDLDTK